MEVEGEPFAAGHP